ncbi:MAG: hypothetical protein R3C60_10875 [Parvularculaceae bacterium]
MLKLFTVMMSTAIALAAAAEAQPLNGVYNTGASEVEGAAKGTLNVRFGACADDPSLTCGVIEKVVDPAPGAKDKMPDGSDIVGFQMINGLKEKSAGKYRGGRINAVDESLNKDKMIWYGVKIDELEGAVKVTGCLGFICPRTLLWKKVGD